MGLGRSLQTSPHRLMNADLLPRQVAIIFDLDGTLVDSEPHCARTWDELARELGTALPTAGPVGATVDARVRMMEHRTGISAEQIHSMYWDRLEACFRKALRPLARTYALACQLRTAGAPVAIASNSRRKRVDRTIEIALPELLGVPSIAADEVAHPKPAPDLFLRAATHLGIEPHDCLVVEDSDIGMAAARAAGMMTLQVHH